MEDDFPFQLADFCGGSLLSSQTKTSTVSTNSFSHNHGSETWIPPVVVSFDVG